MPGQTPDAKRVVTLGGQGVLGEDALRGVPRGRLDYHQDQPPPRRGGRVPPRRSGGAGTLESMHGESDAIVSTVPDGRLAAERMSPPGS
jgi:hypothetical protein